jgi:hypothetical protein
MSEYLKCYYCGKETDVKDSRPWRIVTHMSCTEKMKKEGWKFDWKFEP